MVALFGLKPEGKTLFLETLLLKLAGAYKNRQVTHKGAYIASIMMREFYNGMDYIRETMRSKLKHDDGRIEE
jgi:hypothetical protein